MTSPGGHAKISTPHLNQREGPTLAVSRRATDRYKSLLLIKSDGARIAFVDVHTQRTTRELLSVRQQPRAESPPVVRRIDEQRFNCSRGVAEKSHRPVALVADDPPAHPFARKCLLHSRPKRLDVVLCQKEMGWANRRLPQREHLSMIRGSRRSDTEHLTSDSHPLRQRRPQLREV